MAVLGYFKRFNGLGKFDATLRAISVGCVQSRGLSSSKLFHGGEETMVPVLIVGAGPVGLVLAILLTKLGIFCHSVPIFLDDEKLEFLQRSPFTKFVFALLFCENRSRVGSLLARANWKTITL